MSGECVWESLSGAPTHGVGVLGSYTEVGF